MSNEENNGWLKQWAENVFSQVERIYDILDKHENRFERMEKELNETKTSQVVFQSKVILIASILGGIGSFILDFLADRVWK